MESQPQNPEFRNNPENLSVKLIERTDFLAFMYVMLSCVFVTFRYSILGQVWYLIVLIPDLCFLPYL